MAPNTKEGYWGARTATIDWCENNYEMTFYIAEFWNTVSNMMFILPSLVGAILCVKDRLENRFMWCHISLAVVGLGSWLFHMTLLYYMQLFDELPMIWGSVFLLYSLMEVGRPPGTHNTGLQIAMFIYCLVVTVVYLTLNEPIFHEISYGVLVLSITLASFRIYRYYDHNRKLFFVSFTVYLGGFICWNIDNMLCPQLKDFRQTLPGMVQPLTQFHAWWHIGSAFGTYLSILFCAHARYLFLKKDPNLHLYRGIWPLIRQGQSL